MINPYKQNPDSPIVAILDATHNIISEHGDLATPENPNSNWRTYASYETIAELLHDGYGEALTWNGEVVRWRLKNDDKWKPSYSDVRVLRVQCPINPMDSLNGLIRWRDWLGSYGAAPGSIGQASYSLLRATLQRPLWLACGELPPIKWTMGGRVELIVLQGLYEGRLKHYDLPAAYASTIGTMFYGGRWKLLSDRDSNHAIDLGFPTFVRCKIRIPKNLQRGPIPRRPHKRRDAWTTAFDPIIYPTGKTITGTWTLEEVEGAEKAGCKIKRSETWIHLPSVDWEAGNFWQPFLPWWRAVREGRAMGGFAGLLAKTTGNALWGQLCMSPGNRSILQIKGKGRRAKRVVKNDPVHGGRIPDHGLCETVSGRVRAQLYGFMHEAGERLLSVHTDGAWIIDDGWRAPFGWREKERAEWLRLLSPQVLAYKRPFEDDPVYVFAGVPFSRSERVFRDYWNLCLGDRMGELIRQTVPLLESPP